MYSKVSSVLIIICVLVSCSPTSTEKTGILIKDSVLPTIVVEKHKLDSIESINENKFPLNDTLNALANIMSGIKDTSSVFAYIQNSPKFITFSNNFDKRWNAFDSSRLTSLRLFKDNEISKIVKPQPTLFYPFSGPDILYSQTFFPDANKYVMIGLEPVGSLPNFKANEKDSLSNYFSKVNVSLNAILKFSFFRTQSMKNDLKNKEVDGTLHLLFLFLKRTGNQLSSARPLTIDSLGEIEYIGSFDELKKIKTNTRGVEIKFNDIYNKPKTLYYFSLNAADGGLKTNNGFVTYLKNMGSINTYLKGASYLMHKNYFSKIREVILSQSAHVVQDDSGIALHYFLDDSNKWNYSFYGQYQKPIPMFKDFYQKDLDSLYKQQGATPIGFGIGYNFKDKNSNFMIATKQQ